MTKKTTHSDQPKRVNLERSGITYIPTARARHTPSCVTVRVTVRLTVRVTTHATNHRLTIDCAAYPHPHDIRQQTERHCGHEVGVPCVVAVCGDPVGCVVLRGVILVGRLRRCGAVVILCGSVLQFVLVAILLPFTEWGNMRLTFTEYEVDLLRAALVITANDYTDLSKSRGGCDVARGVSDDCWKLIEKLNMKQNGKK